MNIRCRVQMISDNGICRVQGAKGAHLRPTDVASLAFFFNKTNASGYIALDTGV